MQSATPSIPAVSQSAPGPSSGSNYNAIFELALNDYKTKTRKDLTADPLLSRLESCNSPEAVLTLLREQIFGFNQSRSSDARITNWLTPAINVLVSLSSIISGAVSLAYSPVMAIFVGIANLLTAARGVSARDRKLVYIFERLENLFRRLETCIRIAHPMDIIIKVIAEVLNILALATKMFKEARAKAFMRRLVGMRNIEDALYRLYYLTQHEHWVTTAQGPTTHSVDKRLAIEDSVQVDDNRVDVLVDSNTRAIRELQQLADRVVGHKWNELPQNLERWLSPPNPVINYNIARETHQEGTAAWFIESNAYKDWKHSSSFLWIYGKPGSGKSVLTSAIIDDMKGISNAGLGHMAYFFFDSHDIRKQDARGLLTSIIVQLNSRSQSFHDILLNFYAVHDNGLQPPSISALTRCFQSMIEATGETPIYVIIDALDECPNTNGLPSSRGQVLHLVEKLARLNIPSFHLCVTSRPEIDIRISLEPLTSTSNCISLHDQSGQKEDIVNFVKAVVQLDMSTRKWRPEDKEMVIRVLSERADGTFRWVSCQLEILQQCLPVRLRHVLGELPESLDGTYEQILQQIPKSNREHAHRLLQCLTVSVRPLRVEELAEVLAVDFCADKTTPLLDESLRCEDQEQTVLSAGSSLVVIVEESGSRLVRFSHFSVKQFLISDRLAASNEDSLRYHHIRLEAAHTTMAQACLGVLLRLESHMDRESIESYPLANYAGQHFVEHASFENVLSHVADGVDKLLDTDKPHFDTWVWLQIGDWDPDCWYTSRRGNTLPPSPNPTPLPTYPPRVTPLYYVAALGHLCLTERLILKRQQDLHAKDENGCAPLHIAVLAERNEVSQLIIKYSEGVDMQDNEGRTPLHLAAFRGLSEVARMLLERGSSVNSRDNKGQAALHVASQYSHLSIMRLLLEFGGDVDVLDNDRRTPLHLASRDLTDSDRSSAAARPLLEHGAGIDAENKKGQTPLHLASRHHNPPCVELLLDHGAYVDAQDGDNMTPLHFSVSRTMASDSDFESGRAVVELLLRHGASLHLQNNKGETPLQAASVEPRFMRLLSEHVKSGNET